MRYLSLAALTMLISSAVYTEAFATSLKLVAEIEGAGEGPIIVAVFPEEAHSRTIGPAKQLAQSKLENGKLVIYEYEAKVATPGELQGFVAESIGLHEDVTDIIAVTTTLAAADSRDLKRLPNVASSDPVLSRKALASALSASFGGDSPAVEVVGLPTIANGVHFHLLDFSEEDTAKSRRHRWTRLYVNNFLSLTDTGVDPKTVTAATGVGATSFALYDCEGVGGSGPAMLERIVSGMGDEATVSYVSAEDIREEVLPAFRGVLFPGGSGRGIAESLESKGQDEVRSFISAGGGYVGICAGAYLATCRIDGYLEMAGVYHGQPWRKGGGMVEVELTQEGRAILGEEYTLFETRYNNGPIFGHEEGIVPVGDFEPVQTLAVFKSAVTNSEGQESTEMIGADAISATTYGAGRVLLISPHPESHSTLDPMMHRALRWSVKEI